MAVKRERRFDDLGPLVKMAEVDYYVMVRRPGCLPFVLAADQWRTLKAQSPETAGE